VKNIILNGEALETLKTLESESIDCVITSPPYWQLRDYGVENQLGLEATFQEYIEKLVKIFDEVYRVLKKDGTCWVNLGDTYSGSGGGDKSGGKERFNDYTFKNGTTKTILPNKSLCNIPSRFAIAMQDKGWILRNEIIWQKPNAMPSSVKDRFTIDYEKIFFFVKSQKYYFNQPKEPMITNQTLSKSGRKDSRETSTLPSNKKQDNVGRNDYTGFNDRYTPPENMMRNKRTVWTINTEASSIEHFAMFPNELVETMIEAGCKSNGIVLDPFIGSGTTAIVAKSLNRNYIGIEINKEYAKVAEDRLKNVQLSIFGMLGDVNK
jgi:site-specific DNA-methyltransferase (adenine-specific)